jgi:glycosyltransferase involved in cell wall biosynthesis/O-antigen/teichoic acid export membrane protein
VTSSERRLFLTHNVVATVGTLFAGVFGFALQAMITHRLHPSQYGAAFVVMAFFTLATLPAGAFSDLIAWSTSRDLATNTGSVQSASTALLRSAHRRLLLTGGAMTALFIVTSPWIGEFLQVPSRYVIAGAIGVPFQMAYPLLLGAVQGRQRFTAWSTFSVGHATAKLVGAGALAIPFGGAGVLLGLSAASALLYVIAAAMIGSPLTRGTARAEWSPVMRFLGLLGVVAVAINVLVLSDVVIIKHFFPPKQGGEYAAVAAVSRSLYWGVGGIAAVLFPKVAARHARGGGTKSVIVWSVGLAMAGAIAGLIVFNALGGHVLGAFAGHAYVSGAAYLGWYALGMGLLGAAVVLINAQQSLARFSVLWVLLPATLLKVLLVATFHPTLLAAVQMGDLAIALLLIGLAVLYAVEERGRAPRAAASDLVAVPEPAPPLLVDAAASSPVLLTMVVATTRPGPRLRRAVERILAATADRPVEVVVSTPSEWPDPTPGVRVSLCASHSRGDRLDRAADTARGGYIAFLDDGIELDPGWVPTATRLLDDARVGAAGGPILARTLTRGQRIASIMRQSRLGSGSRRYLCRRQPARPVAELSSANLVVNRQAFRAVGGFQSPGPGGEAVRLCYKLRTLLGLDVLYHPDLAVRAPSSGFPRALLASSAALGRSRGDLARRLPETSPLHAHGLPSAVLLAAAGLAVIAPFQWVGRLGLAVLAAAYLVAAAPLLVASGRLTDKLAAASALWLLPSAYGVGFVRGYLGSSLSDVSPPLRNARPLRVLILNWRDVTHPWAGGAETYMREIGSALVERGCEVGWVAQRHGSSSRIEVIDGIRVHRVGGRFSLYPLAALAYLLRLRRRYDVVVDCANGIPFFAPLYARKPIVLVVHHVHQEIFRHHLVAPLRWLAVWLEGWLQPRVYRRTRVVTVSESTRTGLIAQGFDPANIDIICNGVHPPAEGPDVAASSEPSIACVGRLTRQKSVDVLLRAMPRVLERFPAARLEIVGQGPDRPRLERLCWALQLAQHVRFHGWVPDDAVDELYARAWVAVCPSAFEGWGNTCMEASARGLPVVAARVPGLRDSVRDGVTGVLVAHGDSDALAAEVGALLGDRRRRERMGEAGRVWAAAHDWQTSASAFESVLTAVRRPDRAIVVAPPMDFVPNPTLEEEWEAARAI